MTGWQTIDGKWYYLKTDGRMASEWLQDNGKWYYLLDGAMEMCIRDRRYTDMEKVISDPKYRQKLYEEYHVL